MALQDPHLEDLVRTYVVGRGDRSHQGPVSGLLASFVTSRKASRATGWEFQAHDRQQAVRLGLEVVVERGLPDADLVGDRGPLGVLVAVLAEASRSRR